MKPTLVHDGLAMYRMGSGEPVLLFPYPHSMTLSSMAESPLAELFSRMGRSVITFDPPGAYASTRQAQCTLSEMSICAAETLNRFEVSTAVDIAGHSMGAFCALAFALEHPGWVRRLVMLGCDNLAVHKRLSNLVEEASYVDPSSASQWTVEKGDRRRPAPPRTSWQRNVRRYDLADRLRTLRNPVLLLYGRQDVQTADALRP